MDRAELVTSDFSKPLSRQALVTAPLFGYAGPENRPYTPTISEILCEWLDAMNFVRYPSRLLITLNFAFHLANSIVFIFFVLYRASGCSLLFMLFAVFFLGTIYNTLWYHRYCSHAAFKFRKDGYAKWFLWSNPLFFREECYAIPHRMHHQLTERPGDPYGPHLGCLGSYLAPESTQKLNIEISQQEYRKLVQSIAHIGLRVHNHSQFVRTGSIESVTCYLTRAACAQFFWAGLAFSFGGIDYVLAWISAICCMTFLIRDFNWRGHGGNFRRVKRNGWEFDDKSYALNQRFYGYLASEWHDNHHKYPTSANNGFLPGQIDVAFQVIKLMHRLGIVESYMDARPIFEKECPASGVKA